MNFRFEPYCENCEFVEPVAIRNSAVKRMGNGDIYTPKMTIMCNHARLCKRLHQNIKAAEKVENCTNELVLNPCSMAEEVRNCSDEGV